MIERATIHLPHADRETKPTIVRLSCAPIWRLVHRSAWRDRPKSRKPPWRGPIDHRSGSFGPLFGLLIRSESAFEASLGPLFGQSRKENSPKNNCSILHIRGL